MTFCPPLSVGMFIVPFRIFLLHSRLIFVLLCLSCVLYFVVGMASLWSLSDEVHEEEEEDYDPSVEQDNAATSARLDQIVVANPARRRAAPSATATAAPRSKRTRLNQEGHQPPDGHEASQPPSPPAPPGPKVTTAPKLRSKAWKNFTRIEQPNPDEVVAECNICHTILRVPSKNGTSSLLSHTAQVHPHNTNEVNNYFLKTEKNADGSHSVRNTKLDMETIRAAISMFLVGGSHAFSVIEEVGFKKMIGAACLVC
uniref:BED-type domain-containing protein n=2 Tax=Aegilops tauschii subsp. strangulata TaxID=200361 RepID=A0A453PKZ5_AEGTS